MITSRWLFHFADSRYDKAVGCALSSAFTAGWVDHGQRRRRHREAQLTRRFTGVSKVPASRALLRTLDGGQGAGTRTGAWNVSPLSSFTRAPTSRGASAAAKPKE